MTSIANADKWQEFADATLDHQPEARRIGRQLAGYEGRHRKPGTPDTPPATLARAARHRKPNRRPGTVQAGNVTR